VTLLGGDRPSTLSRIPHHHADDGAAAAGRGGAQASRPGFNRLIILCVDWLRRPPTRRAGRSFLRHPAAACLGWRWLHESRSTLYLFRGGAHVVLAAARQPGRLHRRHPGPAQDISFQACSQAHASGWPILSEPYPAGLEPSIRFTGGRGRAPAGGATFQHRAYVLTLKARFGERGSARQVNRAAARKLGRRSPALRSSLQPVAGPAPWAGPAASNAAVPYTLQGRTSPELNCVGAARWAPGCATPAPICVDFNSDPADSRARHPLPLGDRPRRPPRAWASRPQERIYDTLYDAFRPAQVSTDCTRRPEPVPRRDGCCPAPSGSRSETLARRSTCRAPRRSPRCASSAFTRLRADLQTASPWIHQSHSVWGTAVLQPGRRALASRTPFAPSMPPTRESSAFPPTAAAAFPRAPAGLPGLR